MTNNKKTVEKYMDGFNKLDNSQILSCLTDDVEWILPGLYHHKGKEAFDKEIDPTSTGRPPVVAVTRMIEENDVVLAEGTVRAQQNSGEVLNLVFCDVFEMQDGKIKKLISYLMEVKIP